MQNIEIDKIVPYSRNPRKNQHVDKVASSIKEFGFQQPIVVDNEHVIIVGHTRYQAAIKLGMKEVPVIIANNLSKNQVKAYRIADNRVAEESQWDNELLNLELLDLQKQEFDLESLGFETNELNRIFNQDDPLFVSPEQSGMESNEANIEDFIPSQVRMIQLFLNSESEPKFKAMIENLQEKYNTNNLTDTVYKAIENENNRS
jgi:hypothetical protein